MAKHHGGLVIIMSIFLLLCFTIAENITYPTANQNLSPIEAWRSAEFCLQKKSSSCPEKYTLTDSGWLNVTEADGPAFCSGGCAEHTRAVLLCISQVKRDYWFANHATVNDLNNTINIGCTSHGFNGTSLYSSSALNGLKLSYPHLVYRAVAAAIILMLAIGI